MRSDTFRVIHNVHQSADTLMEYREYKTVVYKRGALLNEQHQPYFCRHVEDRNLKKEYDSSLLFLCRQENFHRGFMASVRNGYINLDTNALKNHSFFKAYRKAESSDYFVEGEDLIEPVENVTWFCGTGSEELPEQLQTANANGLFYRLYMVPGWREKKLVYYAKYDYY